MKKFFNIFLLLILSLCLVFIPGISEIYLSVEAAPIGSKCARASCRCDHPYEPGSCPGHEQEGFEDGHCCDFTNCGPPERLYCFGTIQYCTGEPPCGGGGCFSSETQVSTPGGQVAISELKVGDEVVSQNPESGEESQSLVEKIYEVTRSAYYKIKLKNGTEVKVTGEHPLYAMRAEKKPLTFWEYLKTESLTKKAISWVLNKF